LLKLRTHDPVFGSGGVRLSIGLARETSRPNSDHLLHAGTAAHSLHPLMVRSVVQAWVLDHLQLKPVIFYLVHFAIRSRHSVSLPDI